MQGHPRLVNAIAKLYSKLINRDLNSNTEVLITSGAYEALYATLHGHTNPGDEWIIIEPFFDCYVPMVQTAGGIPRYIALKPVKILNNANKNFVYIENMYNLILLVSLFYIESYIRYSHFWRLGL